MAIPAESRKQLRIIRSSLTDLRRAVDQLAAKLRKAEAVAKASANGAPRKLKLSPARQRALKVHGQYLGYVRQLKPTQKARVKMVKAKKGYPAAIKMAKSLASR